MDHCRALGSAEVIIGVERSLSHKHNTYNNQSIIVVANRVILFYHLEDRTGIHFINTHLGH